MNTITSNGHNYKTQQDAEAYYIDITISEKQYRVYACLGEKDSSPGTVGMLFVRSSDKDDLKKLLDSEFYAEETCSRLDDSYVSDEIDKHYPNHRIEYQEYCLFTFSTNPKNFEQHIESFKQRMEADNNKETLESSNPDASIQESLSEAETSDQTGIDEAKDNTTHKKKIELLAIPCIILFIILVGYATIIELDEDTSKAYSLGDITGDGVIDATDASYVLTAYTKSSTGENDGMNNEQKKFADINGDGVVDAVDASAVLTYYTKSSTGYKGSLEEFMKSFV